MRCIVASLTDDSSNELADVSVIACQQLVVACTYVLEACVVLSPGPPPRPPNNLIKNGFKYVLSFFTCRS